ncbi:ABC transporter ATP-binding protein [Oscillatoria salina]|uniref:ABC transporter ATP-binding protein n=1 Tax=Oscillatoria salina TaxID=331517 RepID=UPI0013BD7970|nr:ATP-binding cassette domain-containing protein [Oscillatoria salina]MBZ8180374.1 ATP-binding cassette domain-containing protein [Oscillatoria salina IIICB1]NET89717.1 ATP-binding cassette domain-containing protein [Kamptonema sp. SIO1D9]
MRDRQTSNNFPLLQLEQVSLAASIGSAYLLHDLSLAIDKGKFLTIVGASGSGKTSLLRLLNRLNEPTTGKIYLENQDYQKIPVTQLRQQIVLVLQEPKLLGMRIDEALAYPLILQQLGKEEIKERVRYWVGRLNIPEEWLDRHELQLSLGQRQLVAIARGLIMQPKILLLDEPTSALDFGRANHLLEILTDLTLTSEMTVIMVNHQLELIESKSDRVLYLQEGKLLQDLPAKEIDWVSLREELVSLQKQTAAEWL